MKYAAFFLVFLLSGCGSPSGVTSSDSGNASSSGASQQEMMPQEEPDKKDVARSNNAFAFSLYKQLKSTDENLFFSPYSISSALAMTYTGAKGVTRQQMSEVFGFYSSNLAHARGYQSLQEYLDSLNQDDLKLHMANALWCQKDYDFQQDFLDINRGHFTAAIRQVNFKRRYQQVREQINQWVEKQTNQKIKDLIDQGVLDRMTRLVLVNAIYFNGKWEYPFSKEKTRENVFYPTPDQKVKVSFMNQSVRLPYHEGEFYKAVEIPYSKGSLSMLILLPNRHEDMPKLESKMERSFYESLTDSIHKEEVGLSIPRFKLEAKYQLNDPLRQMGMKSAFNGNADFSGMTGDKDLYISDIVHQSYVEVHEKGTEAAAATGVVMRKTAIVKSHSFIADHPFLFMIRDQQTHAILFMGKLRYPV
ncbi:MAG: serpin family protein [Bacteroidales bacterium]|nr:serpin family protein [Bacteroidales bacterium]